MKQSRKSIFPDVLRQTKLFHIFCVHFLFESKYFWSSYTLAFICFVVVQTKHSLHAATIFRMEKVNESTQLSYSVGRKKSFMRIEYINFIESANESSKRYTTHRTKKKYSVHQLIHKHEPKFLNQSSSLKFSFSFLLLRVLLK